MQTIAARRRYGAQFLYKTVLFAAAFATASFALAAPPAGHDQTASTASAAQLESQRQEIKYAVLHAQAEARIALDQATFPRAMRVDVYLSGAAKLVSLQRFDFQRFSLSIDDGAAEVFNLGGDALQSLGGNDLLRIERLSLADGPHKLHAELVFLKPGAADQAATQVALDQDFEKTPGAAAFDFSLVAEKLFSSARLQLLQLSRRDAPDDWLAQTVSDVSASATGFGTYVRGSGSDPAMRYVRHVEEAGALDEAVIESIRVANEFSGQGALPKEYWLQTAAIYRVAGLLDRAKGICDRLQALHADPQALATERLHLGESQLELGDDDRAAALLAAARPDLPEYRLQDWRFANAQLLFALNRPAEAIDQLRQASPEQVDAFRYMNEPTASQRIAGYGRFNLAVALINHGEARDGMSWLDLVGRLSSKDELLLALRDKANLVLGWQFLKAKQGRTALGVFGRVRATGAFSDTALLGIGWSQLVPSGKRIPRTRLPDETIDSSEPLVAPLKNSLGRLRVLEPELHGAAGPGAFARDDPPADRDEGLRRAARIWSVLVDHDPDEQAVEEGVLAIAYAQDQLNDRAQAREAYARAIALLKSVEARLADAVGYVRDGKLPADLDSADSEAAVFLIMQRLAFATDDSVNALYSALDRYRNLASLLSTSRQTAQRLSAIGDAAVADARFDEKESAAESASNAVDPAQATSASRAALLARLQSLERNLVALQAGEAVRIQSLALANLDSRFKVIERYLNAAYLSAARVEDRSTPADGPSP